MTLQIQKAQTLTSKGGAGSTSRCITVKLRTPKQRKILNAAREKSHCIFKRAKITLMADFSKAKNGSQTIGEYYL